MFKMTSISRKVKRLATIFLFFIILWLAIRKLWLPQVGTMEASKSDSVPLVDPPPPTIPPGRFWLLLATRNPSLCYTLAASYHDWKILLVLPFSTDLKHSRCHFLTFDLQNRSGNEYLFDFFGNSTEKLAIIEGIIYLQRFQPEAVYVFEKTMGSENEDIPTSMQALQRTFLIYTNNSGMASFFEPLAHFGCRAIQDSISTIRTNGYRFCMDMSGSVINVHAVMPATTMEREESGAPKTCNTIYPSVTLDVNNYAIVFFNGGLFHFDFLWIYGVDTIVSQSNETDECRVLISFALQKIIWAASGYVSIYFPKLDRSTGATLSNTVMIESAVRLVDGWNCMEEVAHMCLINFFQLLRDKELMKESTFMAVQQYLGSLTEHYYNFPRIKTFNPIQESNLNRCPNNDVALNPIALEHTVTDKFLPFNRRLENMRYIYSKTCDALEKKQSYRSKKGTLNIEISFSQPWVQFPDILLIVVFNKPHYEVIPHVEVLYASFFPHIVFCGPGMPDSKLFPNLYSWDKQLNRSFISYEPTRKGHAEGAFNYECAMKAMSMEFNVAGYLIIADDTLLLVSRLENLRKDFVWFLPANEMRIGEISKLRECKLGMCDFFPHWAWWEDYKQNVMDLLQFMSVEQKKSPLIYRCYQQLVLLNGAPMRPSGGYSDVYYIPQRLAGDFAKLSKLFLNYQIFLEIAFPTMIRCLENPGDIVPLKNKQVWTLDRDQPWLFFNRKELFGKAFYHPAKWGYMNGTKESEMFENFYCNRVLPFLHDRFQRLPS